MAYRLARQGEMQVAFPYPGRDFDPSLQRIGGRHTSLSGTQTIDVAARKRQYAMQWNALSDVDFRKLEQFWDGSMGDGPFEFYRDSKPMQLVNIDTFTEKNPYPDCHELQMVLIEV